METGEQLQQDGGGGGGKALLKKGPWTAAEDAILVAYVHKHGEGNWNSLQKHSGLSRCGKSCRLRWANHLRPNLKKGSFTVDEEHLIIELHAKLGNKWARMAAQLPGRTDNEIKNYWNTRIKRRQRAGLPVYPPEVQSRYLPLPCDQAPGLGLSVSTNTDSDSDTFSSSKSDFPRFNLGIEGFPAPLALCEIPINLLPTNGLTMPAPPVAKPIQGFCPPSNNRPLPAEMVYSQKTEYSALNPITKSFLSSNSDRKSLGMVALGFPFEPDPTGIGGQFAGVPPTYHGFASGSYSFFGLDSGLEMELPSDQSVDVAGSADDNASVLVSSFTPLSSSKSMSSEVNTFEHVNNSGLLECLLQEAETKQRTSGFISRDNIFPLQTSDDYVFESKSFWTEDSTGSAPLENYAVAGPIEPIAGTWKSTSGFEPTLTPVIKVEECCGELSWAYTDHAPSTLRDVIRPYEMGSSECCNCQVPNEVGIVSYPVASDTETDVISASSGVKSSYSTLVLPADAHVWELGSCQWNNMPGACLVGDYDADYRAFTTVAESSVDPCAIF